MYWTILFRSLRLRCPRCGQGKMFTGWFRMAESCPACGLKYEREPGYFLGSIYINYGLTAILVVILYFSLYFGEVLPSRQLLWIMLAFSVLFPIWFFRYARSLWVGLDQFWDPVARTSANRGKIEDGSRDKSGERKAKSGTKKKS